MKVHLYRKKKQQQQQLEGLQLDRLASLQEVQGYLLIKVQAPKSKFGAPTSLSHCRRLIFSLPALEGIGAVVH